MVIDQIENDVNSDNQIIYSTFCKCFYRSINIGSHLTKWKITKHSYNILSIYFTLFGEMYSKLQHQNTDLSNFPMHHQICV